MSSGREHRLSRDQNNECMGMSLNCLIRLIGFGAATRRCLQVGDHRRRQDFVWGALFLASLDLFLVVALKDRLNISPNLTHPAKTVLKLTLALAGGCTSCPGGALTHFPCKLRLKNFSPPCGVQVHILHPLATPMSET